jgi:hypothetical protein
VAVLEDRVAKLSQCSDSLGEAAMVALHQKVQLFRSVETFDPWGKVVQEVLLFLCVGGSRFPGTGHCLSDSAWGQRAGSGEYDHCSVQETWGP